MSLPLVNQRRCRFIRPLHQAKTSGGVEVKRKHKTRIADMNMYAVEPVFSDHTTARRKTESKRAKVSINHQGAVKRLASGLRGRCACILLLE